MEMIIAFIAFVFFFIAMAIGVLVANKPLKGSCGGIAAMMGNKECELCGGSPQKCEEERQQKIRADQDGSSEPSQNG